MRALREDRGLTQQEAAEAARLDDKHWGDLERGLSNTTVATLVAIGKALRVSVSDLLEGI